MSSVETGEMSAVETGQISAVETRQMSSVETRQISTGKTDFNTILRLSCLSRRHLSHLNNTLLVCQKHAKVPTHVIATDLDNRTVTFQTDRIPQDRIAVQF